MFHDRVEDTDTARSTRASEEAMIRDLTWLGLTWDEGESGRVQCTALSAVIQCCLL